MKTILVLLCVVLAVGVVSAQEKKAEPKAPPVLTELESTKLDLIVATQEAYRTKLALLQKEFEEYSRQSQAYIESLQKPDYQITRSDKNTWVYAPKPEPKK